MMMPVMDTVRMLIAAEKSATSASAMPTSDSPAIGSARLTLIRLNSRRWCLSRWQWLRRRSRSESNGHESNSTGTRNANAVRHDLINCQR